MSKVSGDKWLQYENDKSKLSRHDLAQMDRELEEELDALSRKMKQDVKRQYDINRENMSKKAYANKYLDRSAQVKAANELYDSYEYNKETRDSKPERKSICNKYMGALSENCTIMFGGKRRSKKKSRKNKKSKRKSRSKKTRKSMRKTRKSVRK